MIKIIKGSYGMRCGTFIQAIPAGSDPIELTEEKEERLVRLGVAEYITAVTEEETKLPPDGSENNQETDGSEDDVQPTEGSENNQETDGSEDDVQPTEGSENNQETDGSEDDVQPTEGSEADTQDVIVDECPEYNEDMKLDELKQIAAMYGVDASSMRSKKEVIEAIDAARAELPDLDADTVVE